MSKLYNPLLLILILISVTFTARGQVSYDVPSDDFPDLESVVTFINQNPAGDNGTVFNISGDTTFDEPLLTLTAQTESTAPYILQWDETGSKPIVNFSGTSADEEAAITLQGARGIIIDGLDIRNPDGMLEYGIFLTNADAETGAQFNMIQNTHITLNKTNSNQTNGIRAFPSFEQTSHEGSNSNNFFIDNHISNVLIGYQLNSNTGQVDLMDTGNSIGTMEGGEHIIEDIVFSGVYLLNQNGAVIDGVQILNLNRPDDGTNTAPASISTTGSLPSGELTETFVISNNRIEGQFSEATSVFGMYLNQRNVHYEIYNNVLNDITTDGVGSSYASGIFIFATGVTADIYNNMISGVAAPASPGISVRGIYVRSFVSVNIFYNSVFIDYAATNSDNISTALSVHNINDPVDLRNNIFVNKTTLPLGGTGFATALLKSTAALGNIQPDSDNNIYYAGTPSPQNLIFYGSSTASDQTLAEFKLRAATFDQNSYTEDVPFLASDDLHVDPLASTVVRGNAQPVALPFAITEDIDGMLRDPQDPDIGADELPAAMPDVATNPTPADGEQNVSYILGSVQWDYAVNPYFVNPAGFKVYFGENEELTELDYIGWIEYAEGEESFSTDIVVLDYTKTYYWKVIPSLDEIDGPEAEQPEVWSFTTESFTYDYPNPAENPIPANNAENISLDLASLSWGYIFNDMFTEPAGFLVYFGDSDNFTEEDMIAWVEYDNKEEVYTVSIESIELLHLTDYYWKVVPTVSQEDGPEAENVDIWTFSTEAFVHEFPNTAENPAPADGATQVSLELTELAWDYLYDENYTLAEGFWVYLGTSMELTEEDLLGWVSYNEELTTYSIVLEDFTPEPLTSYHWQVVPSADMDNGPLAENVQTWSFTTDEEVSVGNPEMSTFLMYPNPASENLFLTVPHQGLIRIISIDGRIVKEQEVSDLSAEIELTDLKEGTYIVNFVSELQNLTRILVITK